MNPAGFLLVTAEDAAHIAAALSASADPTLLAIAARLQDGGARKPQKPRPSGRRASELWDTYIEVRKQVPVGVAAFLAQEKDPFPGTEGEARPSGRCTKEQMDDRVEVAAFCILAQPNGVTSDVLGLLSQRWGVSEQMVYRTMKHAIERLRGQARPDEELRAKVVAHGWNVYDAAMRSKRPQAAVGALDGIAKNAGLVQAGVNVNILSDPRFQEAARRYVDAVQTSLAAHDEIAARVAPQLGAVPAETIAAILAAADALIAERVAPEPPRLPE